MKTVHLYTKTSCSSSRKAKEYLKVNNIPFKETKICTEIIPRDLVKTALLNSENGIEDVVKRTLTNSKRFKDITIEEFIDIIVDNPPMLKTPIMTQGYKFVVGFNIDEMGVFLPRETKQMIFQRNLIKA